jgi:hypothetical protein
MQSAENRRDRNQSLPSLGGHADLIDPTAVMLFCQLRKVFLDARDSPFRSKLHIDSVGRAVALMTNAPFFPIKRGPGV